MRRMSSVHWATVVLALEIAACARPEPAPRPPETTGATYVPSASGPATSAWTDEGGPISPGVPGQGNTLERQADGGVHTH